VSRGVEVSEGVRDTKPFDEIRREMPDKPAGRVKEPEYLSTLERGLSVLRAFNKDRPEMQLSEVAVATDLSPAVARRCLNTLVALGYVAKHGRKFLLRPEVLSFGWSFMSSMNLETVALPHLQKVRDETGDSSSMAVLSGHDVLYIAHVSTERPIRLSANVGTRFPAHATSLGKVLLAFQPQEVIDAYLASADFVQFTENSVSSRAEMQKRLQDVRTKGFDVAKDELDFGIISLSVPIFDSSRKIACAINCSTSTTRVSVSELVKTRTPLLREAAISIQDALRQSPHLSHSLSGG